MRAGGIAAILLAAGLLGASAAPPHHGVPHPVARPAPPALAWAGSWAAAQQLPEPANRLPEGAAKGGVLRQVVHLSLGGTMIRIRISNAHNTAPLHLLAAHVARPVSGHPGAIDPKSDRALSFSGLADPVVPPGADIMSDPVPFAAAPFSDLAVTLRFDASADPTGHPGARATSFFIAEGDPTAAELADPATFQHWYMLAGVEVLAARPRGAVVALGDSITDGRGSVPDANNRWPDDLARRLAPLRIGVLNMGIGGNRVLLDGLGPNALARLDRDVLAQPGARWLILLEGINDLGVLTRDAPVTAQEHAALVARLVAGYRQLVTRAHARGLKVLGGTLTPWGGSTYYHPDALNEADRQAVNAWIRGKGHFDGIVDFDARLRDPAAPGQLLPLYDCGDHLHPSPAGYQAMADLIPLGFFR